jgi:hypothetical protein
MGELKEVELAAAIASDLRQRGWDVQQDKKVGLYRPDFILRAPNGVAMLAELKADRGLVHFSSVGQAAAYRSGLAASGGPTPPVTVLLSTGRAAPEIEALAAEMDVVLITQEPKQGVASAAHAFAEQLVRLAEAQAESP